MVAVSWPETPKSASLTAGEEDGDGVSEARADRERQQRERETHRLQMR